MSAYEGIEIPLELGTQGLRQSLGAMEAVLKALGKINTSVSSVSGNMSGMGGRMNQEFRTAERGAEGLIDKLGKIGLAIQGVKGIAQSVMGSIAPIFEEGLGRDASVASLKTLLGTKEEATAYAKELRDSMMSKLYGSGTITDAAKTMMSFGIDKDKTKEMLSAISDIAGGNSQSFNSLVLAFSQATSLGKLQGQDKLQMIGAGFNPLTQIAKDLNLSVKDVDEMMSKGQIDAKMLADAFTNATKEGGTYFGATKEQMGGLNGQIKSLQSKMADIYADIYEKLQPIAMAILPKVSSVLEVIAQTIKGNRPDIEALLAVVGSLGTALLAYNGCIKASAMWTEILTIKQWSLTAAMDANPIGFLIAVLAALIALITVCVRKYDEWGAALLMVAGPFGLIVNMVQSFRRNWDDLVQTFRTDGIVAGFKKIGAVLLDAVLYPLQQMLELLGGLGIPGLSKLAGRGVSAIQSLRSSLGVNMGGVIPGEKGDPAMGGEGAKGGARSSALASGTSAVATGGTRNTQITISMGSLVHQISYNGGIKENTRETTQDLQEALLRVLNAAAQTAG